MIDDKILPELVVGDLVFIAKNAPAGGELAFVYETYPDFDNKRESGVSLITQSGRDTGGWSRKEQKQWLSFVRFSGLDYDFKNVSQVALDFQNGYFNKAFNF